MNLDAKNIYINIQLSIKCVLRAKIFCMVSLIIWKNYSFHAKVPIERKLTLAKTTLSS